MLLFPIVAMGADAKARRVPIGFGWKRIRSNSLLAVPFPLGENGIWTRRGERIHTKLENPKGVWVGSQIVAVNPSIVIYDNNCASIRVQRPNHSLVRSIAEFRQGGMAEEGVKLGSSKPMIATQQEMMDNRVPIPYRDQCAHLLIPLNKCRSAEFFLPWKCEAERHTYERCEYELVMERMLQMQKIRELEEKKKKKAKQVQGAAAGIPLIPSSANA
ncbi:hypothetical protein GW17_00035715 [Ensete ventricosum]|nr:hypothetical protein GW17_00035715 [Ensete ventricosum]